jgi:hypothetical protein
MPSDPKARKLSTNYGTAEAVPFLKTGFTRKLFKGAEIFGPKAHCVQLLPHIFQVSVPDQFI